MNAIPVLPCSTAYCNSFYGWRTHPITKIASYHRGIDMPVRGNAISIFDGTVMESSYNTSRGYYVKVNHGSIEGYKIYTLYQHLAKRGVGVGTNLKQGDSIGVIGATGQVTGTHLHFEYYIDKTAVDPLDMLIRIPSSDIKHILSINNVGYFLEVKRLQEKLVALNIYTGDIDGRFGPKTRNAVLTLQQKYNLAIDGIVGPITRNYLFSI